MARTTFRLLAAGLTVGSAMVLVLYLTGPGQCAVPMEQSLSLYGPPMSVRPGLCSVESVVPVWPVAVAGMWLGLSHLLLVRAQRPGRSAGSIGS